MKYVKKYDTHLNYEADEREYKELDLCEDEWHVHITNVEPNRLRFIATQNSSTIAFNKISSYSTIPAYAQSYYNINLQYSIDSTEDWQEYTWDGNSGLTITLQSGSCVYFKGSNELFSYGSALYHNIKMTGKFLSDGDVTSLLNEIGGAIPLTASFYGLFSGCEGLITPPKLPSKTLSNTCYQLMFNGCSSLTDMPELPASELAIQCYCAMFSGCSSLTGITSLNATVMTDDCYSNMFRNCTSLVVPPELPSTILAMNCYNSMFRGCSSLASAPSLPATAMTINCYYSMFRGCYSLIEAPELPATALADACYCEMFFECTSLLSAPELPATNLYNSCYGYMFYSAISLTYASSLNAQTLKPYCYRFMYSYCTSLVNPPYIGADTTAIESCRAMFAECTSLTSAPDLMPKTLTQSCYQSMFGGCVNLVNGPIISCNQVSSSQETSDAMYGMFNGCSKLKSVRMEYNDSRYIINANIYYSGHGGGYRYLHTAMWLQGVASNGSIYLPTSYSINNKPASWTVKALNTYTP